MKGPTAAPAYFPYFEHRTVQQVTFASLSEQQHSIIMTVALSPGITCKELAYKIGTSPKTVMVQVHRLIRKGMPIRSGYGNGGGGYRISA